MAAVTPVGPGTVLRLGEGAEEGLICRGKPCGFPTSLLSVLLGRRGPGEASLDFLWALLC